MNSGFEVIASGTATTPDGFSAGAVQSGIKSQGELDLAILYSKVPCVAAGVFTSNTMKAAPVILSHNNLQDRKAQAVVINSGCANAYTDDRGMADATAMAALVANKLLLSAADVLVASTGVIGVPLPMDNIREGISRITLSQQGGHALAKAIMTTDTHPKEIALPVKFGEDNYIVAGVAKGAGMIHPDFATMLCFLTTDAVVVPDFLQTALQKAVDKSFNMVTVDGDTSPNDMVILLANGLADNHAINSDNGQCFQDALDEICLYLAKCLARDGEGATKMIEVSVESSLTESEARLAARTIASSPLVKAAMHGNDPNWGRIVAAAGRSKAQMSEQRLDLCLNGFDIIRQGRLIAFDEEQLRLSLDSKEVSIKLCLNLGNGKATAWGCDLSEEYVTINSTYTT